MQSTGNLCAIGYDDMVRADQIGEEVEALGWDRS
jgi:hypothetical protein